MTRTFLLVLAAISTILCTPMWGQQGPEASETQEAQPAATSEEDLAKIAEQTNNPVGNLWMLFIQHDLSIYKEDLTGTGGNRVLNSFKFQPVTPFLLTPKWQAIIRPVLQVQSFDLPELTPAGLGFSREGGLGDTVLLSVLSPTGAGSKVFGFGLSQIFPTATTGSLGQEKWSAGPALLAFSLGKKWVLGAVAQHWWSLSGTDNRADVSLTDFQYVIRYKVNPFFQIGTGPNIQYDWKTEDWNVPIGMGMDITTMWGKTPFRWGFDLQYYVERFDGFGPEWNVRLFFIPVIKAPPWASKPIFGKSKN